MNISSNHNLSPANKSKSIKISELDFMVIFSVATMILLFLLPEDILDYSNILRGFVNAMSFFPSIEKIGKYSEFPQVAQLLYSIDLVSIIIFSILFYKYYTRNHSWLDSGTLGPKGTRTAFSIFGLIYGVLGLIFVFILFPGAPGGKGAIILLTYSYYSKLAFSFATGIVIGMASMPFGLAVYCLSSRHRY
jgi:hypothetical protein